MLHKTAKVIHCFRHAAFHAFLELVERDAIAIWWYNQLTRPGIDPRTATSPELIETTAVIVAGTREWSLIDLTTDLGIPVVGAISHRDGRDLGFGFGAHPDAQIAAARALRECAQAGMPGAGADRANLAADATAKYLDGPKGEEDLNPDPYCF